MTAANSKRALIYTRISRDDTGLGASNDRQREACENLARARGWTVVGSVDDVSFSAASGKFRPGWSEVVERMKLDEFDVVLAWQLDRVTRSVAQLVEIAQLAQDTGVGVATASGDLDLTTPQGKMLATLLATVAEYEGEQKAARQKLANRKRATEGVPWSSGWQAFGYTLGGEVIPAEADTFRETFYAVLDGRMTLKEAARQWNAYGHKSRGGSSSAGWTHRGVKSVVLNPRYAGIATYRGEEVGEGRWEPLITRAEHAQMKALLTDPARRTNSGKGGRTAQTLLAGIARCGKCGSGVNGGVSQGRPVYKCKSPSECVRTPREDADAYVLNGVRAAFRVIGPENLIPRPEAGTAGVALAQMETLRERQNALARAFAAGAITEDQLTEGSADLAQQIRQLERAAAPAAGGRLLRSLGTERRDAVRHLNKLGLPEQRRLLQTIADVTLIPRGRGRRNVPISEQVEGWLKLAGSDDAVSLAYMHREDAGR